jgi:nucleotide-binding universal stress UspA family protein
MFSLGKILLPIDFSERCRVAVRHPAPFLAKHFGSEVTVLHVLPPYIGVGGAELGMMLSEDLITEMKVNARRDVDSFLSEELRELSVKRVLLEGDPAQEIIKFAHSEHSDLIMVPTHGYGPFRRLLLGSVTSKVLHDADCPVWTGVHLEREPSDGPMALGHILCAIDLGPHSAKTLDWANQLAAECGSRLTMVHVVASLDPRTQEYYFAPEWRKYLIDRAREDTDKLQQTVGVRAEVDLEVGDVAKSVCFVAQHRKADLLVIGRGSPAGVFGRFRTNAYSIIRQSPCPVVSV